MEKNQIFQTVIEDMSEQGEGIGKVDGYTLFIKDTIIGDKIEGKVIKAKKTYGYGKMMSILEPSPDRVQPKCPVAAPCGGCQLQAMSYERQLKFKMDKVKNHLTRIGGFDEETLPIYPTIGMDEPFRYRNKGQFPFGMSKDGRIIYGFYAGRTHSIIEAKDCLLGDPVNEQILEIIRSFMEEFHIRPYDEEKHTGLVRHALIRVGHHTKEIMVCLVINGTKLPHSDVLVKRLETISGMTSISLNVNKEKTNVILGSQMIWLSGKQYITDFIGPLSFEISPLSFFQVNPVQTEKLYGTALSYADLSGHETVWDLYCGIGTISLFLAQKAKKVYGVEIIPAAIENAKENAVRNNLTNTEFFVGKSEEVLPKWLKEQKAAGTDEGIDVICVDPPRKGCDQTLLDTMLRMEPKKIVYVSCDSATLARDLKILCEEKYTLEKVQPVDMFPQSCHVESVCLLSKLHEAKHHVNVKLDMDELDLTSAEAKATYKEIEEWVQEHYGFHVTNLNIAQVKQKHGIIERENYNKPKSEDSRQPGCQEEKVKAIEDALRHFQMI